MSGALTIIEVALENHLVCHLPSLKDFYLALDTESSMLLPTPSLCMIHIHTRRNQGVSLNNAAHSRMPATVTRLPQLKFTVAVNGPMRPLATSFCAKLTPETKPPETLVVRTWIT